VADLVGGRREQRGRGAVAGNGATGGKREPDTDLRRRAAWLLGMLAIVAVLLVVVMSQLVGTDGGSKGDTGPRDLDSAVGQHPPSSPPATGPSSRPHSQSPRDSTPPGSSGGSAPVHGKKCPTKQTCALDGDPGGGIAAINEYRTQHGKAAVPGKVGEDAQTCALHNGSGCSGGWAETELSKPDGAAAVQKILPFAHLLDDMKSVEIGWAYDPGAKLYYFAIIRKV
jgi:hypothetical protein